MIEKEHDNGSPFGRRNREDCRCFQMAVGQRSYRIAKTSSVSHSKSDFHGFLKARPIYEYGGLSRVHSAHQGLYSLAFDTLVFFKARKHRSTIQNTASVAFRRTLVKLPVSGQSEESYPHKVNQSQQKSSS